ncbi:hypothetical protein [Paenibacillus sp. YN15]|uniref:hypothetical protein n=1 Tax=Paenibacillus sp. YN15 TaxID=1742774 RepID=UPI000DCE2CF1|nr:hypothetical protein [Paenibacillus sp. YN15]RAV06607.1 hypothetical protein DQG13_01915 [Paenibacillus sp. YN15]
MLLAQVDDYRIVLGSNNFDFLADLDAAVEGHLTMTVFDCQLQVTLGKGEQVLLGGGIDIELVQVDLLGP